jgi:hypothetical protein
MQEPQPLGRSLCYEKIDAGRVAAGVGKAGDKAKLDRVSVPSPKTIGIVAVAAFTASATSGVPIVAITATWLRTKSAISGLGG